MINVCSSAAETADSRTHGVAVTSMTAFIFKFRTSNHLLEEHRVFQKLAWMYHPLYPLSPTTTPDLTMMCQWATAARAWSQNINVLHHQRVLFCLCFFFYLCWIRIEANGGRNLDNDHSGLRAKSFLPICLLNHCNVSGRQDRDDD